jgi:hypothetical protein
VANAVVDFHVAGSAILRRLIYPVQFESDPLNGIDRVAGQVLADRARLPLQDVIAALDAGLASGTTLSELIPQSHSEAVIRSFLAAMRVRLESELGSSQPT